MGKGKRPRREGECLFRRMIRQNVDDFRRRGLGWRQGRSSMSGRGRGAGEEGMDRPRAGAGDVKGD